MLVQTRTRSATLRHEIFILDAYLREPLDRSRMEPVTRQLMRSLLGTLEMEELGPLQIYPAADPRAPGWSFIQPITTSHISGHYFERPGRFSHIRMDVYSCESVDWQRIIEVVHDHLNLREWRGTFVNRHIDPGDRSVFHVAGAGPQPHERTPLEPAPASALA